MQEQRLDCACALHLELGQQGSRRDLKVTRGRIPTGTSAHPLDYYESHVWTFAVTEPERQPKRDADGAKLNLKVRSETRTFEGPLPRISPGPIMMPATITAG